MKKSLMAGSLIFGLALAVGSAQAQSRGGHGGGGGGHMGGGHSGGGRSGGGWHGGGRGGGSWHGGGRGSGSWHGGGSWHGNGSWHGGGSWHGHGGHWGHGGHVIVSPGWGWGWGGWGWGWGWGWGYSPYWGPYYGGAYYGPGYGPYVSGGASYGEQGPAPAVVDTDVSPDEARVILDGRYIGTADDFDGFPDYLYLGRGKYRIEFVLEGFETKVVDIDARPGTMTKIDDKLHKIPGAKQYGSYNTPEPEGGVQRYFVKHGDKSSPETGPGPEQYESQPPPDQGSPEGDEPPPQEAPPPRPVRSAPSSAPAPPSPSSDWRDHPQGSGSGSVTARPAAPSTRLNVKAEPADAAVYLDDRFIGTAEELSGMVRGVRVSPGRHRVTVSRPGYAEKTVEVEIETGTTGSVDVELQR